MRCEIRCFSSDTPPPASHLSELHAIILPHSPVVLLGRRFMEEFYYTVLPREARIFGAIAYLDDRPVGFVVATTDSSGFMSAALRAHWVRLGWIIGTSLIVDPRRIGALWEAWQIMRHLPAGHGGRIAELLSTGVLPEYLTPDFIRASNRHLSRELLDAVLAMLAVRGARCVRVVVERDNVAARFFYQQRGWVRGQTQVPGWRSPGDEFLYTLERR